MIARHQRGVTIIEAMVVVAVIAILLASVAPTGGEWLANSRIRSASESMLAGLQLARTEAVRRNARVEFVLDGTTGGDWTVRTALSGEEIQQRAPGEGTSNVTITAAPQGATRISFDGLGRRTINDDGSDPITSIDLDLPETILASNKTRNLRLQIDLGGQITMCDPNVSTADDVRKCQ